MANFCLHKDDVKRFLTALKTGELDPAKLAEMSSDERRSTFESVIGKDNAEKVNTEFEKKLLTKNIEQTMVTWARDVAGLKPEVRRDLINRIERMDERILQPENEKKFLKDLAAQKLGVGVSMDEVQKINELTDAVREAKAKVFDKDGNPLVPRDKNDYTVSEDELAYDNAVQDADSYVTGLKMASSTPGLLRRIVRGIYEMPRRVITIGHGGVIPFTHARTSLFTPGEARIFGDTAVQAYSYMRDESGTAKWKRDMAALRMNPNFDFAYKVGGLDVGSHSHPVGMGMNRWTTQSFDALKTMRMKLFNKYWERLSPATQTPEMAKHIATLVNHATGTVQTTPTIAKLAGIGMFAPKLRFAKYASVGDMFTSRLGRERAIKMVAMNVALLAVNDLVNRYLFDKTGNDTVNWTDPTRADWLRMKVAGITIPMAPIFEMARLPVRIGATLLDPSKQDKWRPVTSEIASAAHPTLNAAYGLASGKESWSGRALPFPGLQQEIYGDHRKKDNQIGGWEYAANYTPIPAQPILKEFAKNGVRFDGSMGPSVVEALLSGLMGTHAYENVPYTPKVSPAAELKNAVHSGKTTIEDAKDQLQQKLDNGEITNKQFRDQSKRLELSETVDHFKQMHAVEPNDFSKLESELKALPPESKEEIKTVIGTKIANKVKDGSPKALADAEKLRALADKYLDGASEPLLNIPGGPKLPKAPHL